MTIKGINSSYKPSSLQGMENNPQKINDFPSEKNVFSMAARELGNSRALPQTTWYQHESLSMK